MKLSSRCSLVCILSPSASKSALKVSVVYVFFVKSSSRYSPVHILSTSSSKSAPVSVVYFCPECVAKGSRFTSWGLGVETCSRDPASGARNRPQTFAHGNRRRKVVYGESHKNVSFLACQKMWSCRFAWQAWRSVTFDMFQEECVCATVVRVKLSCLWGKPQKRVFLDVSQNVVMSFCVADVALCDIRRVSGGMSVRNRGMGKATKTCLS